MIEDKTIQEKIGAEKGLLLYFYTDSCSACKSLRPKVDDMMQSVFPKMECLYVRSDEHAELCAQLGVFSNPTLIVYFEGKEYARWSKYVSTHDMESSLSRLYNMVFDA